MNDIEAAARAAAEYVDGVWRKDAGTAWTPIRLPLIRDAVASALAHDTRGGVKCAKCGEVISTAGCLCGSNTPVTIAPPPATGEAGTRGEGEIRKDERKRCEDAVAALMEIGTCGLDMRGCKPRVVLGYAIDAIRALPEAREGKWE